MVENPISASNSVSGHTHSLKTIDQSHPDDHTQTMKAIDLDDHTLTMKAIDLGDHTLTVEASDLDDHTQKTVLRKDIKNHVVMIHQATNAISKIKTLEKPVSRVILQRKKTVRESLEKRKKRQLLKNLTNYKN